MVYYRERRAQILQSLTNICPTAVSLTSLTLAAKRVTIVSRWQSPWYPHSSKPQLQNFQGFCEGHVWQKESPVCCCICGPVPQAMRDPRTPSEVPWGGQWTTCYDCQLVLGEGLFVSVRKTLLHRESSFGLYRFPEAATANSKHLFGMRDFWERPWSWVEVRTVHWVECAAGDVQPDVPGGGEGATGVTTRVLSTAWLYSEHSDLAVERLAAIPPSNPKYSLLDFFVSRCPPPPPPPAAQVFITGTPRLLSLPQVVPPYPPLPISTVWPLLPKLPVSVYTLTVTRSPITANAVTGYATGHRRLWADWQFSLVSIGSNCRVLQTP